MYTNRVHKKFTNGLQQVCKKLYKRFTKGQQEVTISNKSCTQVAQRLQKDQKVQRFKLHFRENNIFQKEKDKTSKRKKFKEQEFKKVFFERKCLTFFKKKNEKLKKKSNEKIKSFKELKKF